MSGFEIVGVVLGGFPLLVSAAEHYGEGFEPLKKWWRFRTDFIDFIDTVDIQKQAFDLFLEHFLVAAEVPFEEIQHLLTDPDYKGWGNEAISRSMVSIPKYLIRPSQTCENGLRLFNVWCSTVQ